MKKSTFLRWTIICLLTFTFSNLLAQNTFNQDTSFNSQMNQVFAPLDKSRIPFGILQDFAMELTNLAAYNGTLLVDSTKTTYGTVMDIYNTLCYGHVARHKKTPIFSLVF